MLPKLPRALLENVQNKVEFYIKVHRFDAAEKLIKATLADHGHNAVLYNLLGVIYYKQSMFNEALVEFENALKQNSEYVEAALNLASVLCDLSRYDEARKVFQNIESQLNLYNRVPNLFLGRLANQHSKNGKLYEECGMENEAIREYKTALSLFDKLVDVRLSLAKLYLKKNHLELAQEQIEKLLMYSPNSYEARNMLGIIYYKLGYKDMAKEQWAQAYSLNPADSVAKAYLQMLVNN